MRRQEWAAFIIGILILAVYLFWLAQDMTWQHDTSETLVSAGGCAVPATVMESVVGPKYFVVVLHGLGANRRIMYPLSRSFAAADARVYVLDLPGHGDSTDAFSFERVEKCAAAVIESLEQNKLIQLDRTVLIGHSMGGALAIRLADYFPTAATIAISPAPMVRTASFPSGAVIPFAPPRRLPGNLLIFTGQFDIPFMSPAASKLVEMAGGERKDAEDFRQRRAVQWVRTPHATHTSLIYSEEVATACNKWREMALPTEYTTPFFPPDSLAWSAAMGLLGLLIAFPSVASLVAKALRASEAASTHPQISIQRTFLYWALAGLAAVIAVRFFVPLGFLRMRYGDYLASCLLLAGIVLCELLWSAMSKRSTPAIPWRAVAVGAVLGVATMLAFGAWMNWTLTDVWLNAARWIRFPVILLACLPYAFAEEWALGAPSTGNWLAKLRRYLLFVSLRLLIWLSILFATYVFASGQILLGVLVFYMGAFSLFTRFGADAVRRRTGSPAGAAVFTAILMAWFIAAVFPIT